MSVQRRVNWISQQRVDVPDVRSIESAASNDFDQLIQAFVTGTSQGYFLRGFEISMVGAIGGAANSLQVLVDPGSIFHILASQSGTFLMVPPGTAPQTLNASTNPIVDGAFTPNAVNYVGLDYERFIDNATSAQVYIWDPNTKSEITKTAPRAQILRYRLSISTTPWPSNILPIAIVITNPTNNVVSITDSRWMLFRLGQGGANPNPLYTYPAFTMENPPTSTNSLVNPFEGGDKEILSLKGWMDSVMTALQQIKGTTFWYSSSSAGSVTSIREDAINTVVTGNTNISHGILPNQSAVLTTTGDISSTTNPNLIINLASVSGLAINDLIIGSGIPTNTRVTGFTSSPNTVSMSNNATATITGNSLSFYSPASVTGPGQINWASTPAGTGQIYLRVIGSRLAYQIVENPTGNSVTLTNGVLGDGSDSQVAFISLIRGVQITPNLVFTNGGTAVSSVGSVPWTSNLQAGDFVKQGSDTDAGYFEILSVNSPSAVTLLDPYTGASTGPSGAKSNYAIGVYTLPGQTGTARDMQILPRYAVPMSEDTVWMFFRSDDGGSTARVYVKFLGTELQQGATASLSGPSLNNLLQYIGSPTTSSTSPAYVTAVNSNAIPQITNITVGAATTVVSNEYFYINSSGSSRQYYVWINKNGTGVDPKPLFVGTGIEWDVTTGQTANQLATNLAIALNGTFFDDFTAVPSGSTVVVTNNSDGVATAAANFNVGAPFSIITSQTGIGPGNYSMNDGDNLTLAIKKVDEVIASMASSFQRNGYDEIVAIVASGATPPSSLNGPISSLTNIQLPNDSRNGFIPMFYGVGSGKLEVFLNGQKLIVGGDYSEVGLTGAASNQIEILRGLVVGDELEFTFGGGGGGGGGGAGTPGATGPAGPPGANAAGGPVSISTKTSSYTVLITDCVVRADCSSNPITFTLPLASTATGRIFYLKKIDVTTNTMTILASGSDTIDGLASQLSSLQYESFSLISNGTSWDIF